VSKNLLRLPLITTTCMAGLLGSFSMSLVKGVTESVQHEHPFSEPYLYIFAVFSLASSLL